MRAIFAAAVVVFLLWAGAASARTVSDFKGGGKEARAFLGSSPDVVAANLSIKAQSHVLSAVMKVSGLGAAEGKGAYPGQVSVRLGSSTIWEFNGTGAGALGRQGLFSDGSAKKEMRLDGSTISNDTSFTIPKAAVVKNATLQAECRGEEVLQQMADWHGGAPGDLFAKSVSGAGDVNGDGYGDIIVGISANDTVAFDAGAAQIFFGGPALGARPNITLLGEGFNNIFGATVSGAGDVNGDGYDDVIVGAPWNSSGVSIGGAAYIYFGGPAMDSRPDVAIYGTTSAGYLGMSVSGAGDVNGDGYDDVIVGESGSFAGGPNSGAARVYFGGPAMDNTSDVNLSGLAASDSFGWSVSGAGDVNGDGFGDVVVGAYYNDAAGTDAGAAYVFFGGAHMDSQADLTMKGAAAGDAFGYSVSGAGDVNGDGYGDVMAGAMRNSARGNQSGRAYIYFGGSGMDATADAVITGAAEGDFLGASVSDAGDFNRDGFGDVLVSAPWSSAPGNNSGQAYVFFGSIPMDDIPDVTFNGSEYWDKYGFALSGAGDTNRDGYDEVVIGSAWEDINGADSGRAFVYARAPFMQDPHVEVGPLTVWSAPGSVAGRYRSSDFSGYLNGYLGLTPAAGDWGWGNPYAEVPVKVGARCPGGILLSGLNVTYEYQPATPDFAEALNAYLSAHRQDKDQNGNVTVPLWLGGSGAGGVRLFDLNLTVDEGPMLIRGIPSLEVDEDTSRDGLLDLWGFYQDDCDPGPALCFSVVRATPDDIVSVGISGGRYLSADALNGDANDNWTGAIRVVLRCTDRWGLAADSNEFEITVRNLPDAPAFTSVPVTEATSGLEYLYRLAAVDGDGDAVSLVVEKMPQNMTLDPRTGMVRWTPTTAGSYAVSVAASDGRLKTYQNFTIFVTAVNKLPKFTSMPVTDASAGVNYVYEAGAMDLDGDRLSFSLLVWPGSMAINTATGTILWAPSREESGNFTVTVKVMDGKGGEALQQFTVNVLPFAKAKLTITQPSFGKTVSGNYIFAGKVERGTLEVLGVQLRIDSGEWMNATGNQSWGMAFDTGSLGAGEHTLQARAIDASGFSDTVSVRFRVEPAATATGNMAVFAVISALALCAGATALLFWMRRRRPRRYDWG